MHKIDDVLRLFSLIFGEGERSIFLFLWFLRRKAEERKKFVRGGRGGERWLKQKRAVGVGQ